MNKDFVISKEVIKVELTNGYYLFKLGKLLAEKNISLNQFQRDTNTHFGTIRKHANGEVTQMDLDLIDKWCGYLNVSDREIYEYIKK